MDNTKELYQQIWPGLANIKMRIFQICYVMELFEIPVTRNIDDDDYLDLERSSALAFLIQEACKTTANMATEIFNSFEELKRSLE